MLKFGYAQKATKIVYLSHYDCTHFVYTVKRSKQLNILNVLVISYNDHERKFEMKKASCDGCLVDSLINSV